MQLINHLADVDVLELGGEGEEAEQLDVRHGRLQIVGVHGHGLVRHVVVGRHAPQGCHLGWFGMEGRGVSMWWLVGERVCVCVCVCRGRGGVWWGLWGVVLGGWIGWWGVGHGDQSSHAHAHDGRASQT